jgi:prepilin-type processing-associated H-X9-DG protein
MVDIAASSQTVGGSYYETRLAPGETWKLVSHQSNDGSPLGVNVLYFDGHVSWTPKGKMRRRLRSALEGGGWSFWW